MFPADGTGMPSVDEAEVVEYFDDLLEHLPLKEKVLIRCLIALLEVQMLAFNGLHPKLFSRASPEERTKNLAGWETSSIFQRRLVFMAIRTLLLWGYVDSQEAERDMGFSPGTRRTEERNHQRLLVARRAIEQAKGNEPLNGHDRGEGLSGEAADAIATSARDSSLGVRDRTNGSATAARAVEDQA